MLSSLPTTSVYASLPARKFCKAVHRLRCVWGLASFLIPVASFAATNDAKYYQEDQFYGIYWATANGWGDPMIFANRELIFVHADCTVKKLEKQMKSRLSYCFAVFRTKAPIKDNVNTYIVNRYFKDNEKTIRALFGQDCIVQNRKDLQGKIVYLPTKKIEFDKLPSKGLIIGNGTSGNGELSGLESDNSQDGQKDGSMSSKKVVGTVGVVVVVLGAVGYYAFSHKQTQSTRKKRIKQA